MRRGDIAAQYDFQQARKHHQRVFSHFAHSFVRTVFVFSVSSRHHFRRATWRAHLNKWRAAELWFDDVGYVPTQAWRRRLPAAHTRLAAQWPSGELYRLGQGVVSIVRRWV